MTSKSKRKLALKRVKTYEAARRKAWDAELASIGEFDLSDIDGAYVPAGLTGVILVRDRDMLAEMACNGVVWSSGGGVWH